MHVDAWFAHINSFEMHVCDGVDLQRWRQRDTWHHGDVTWCSTPQNAGDTLTCRMRQQGRKKTKPQSQLVAALVP